MNAVSVVASSHHDDCEWHHEQVASECPCQGNDWTDQQLRRLHSLIERRIETWPSLCGTGSGFLLRAMRMLEQADEYLEKHEREQADV